MKLKICPRRHGNLLGREKDRIREWLSN